MKFLATINNLEFRGLEEKTSKKTGDNYLIVRFDDEAADRVEFLDRDLERKPFYKRGKFYNVTVQVVHSTYTNITLVDAKEVKEE